VRKHSKLRDSRKFDGDYSTVLFFLLDMPFSSTPLQMDAANVVLSEGLVLENQVRIKHLVHTEIVAVAPFSYRL
jgi:hypothetical protein